MGRRASGRGRAEGFDLSPDGRNEHCQRIRHFYWRNHARAVALLWKSGADSLVDDIRFLGGHGSGVNPITATIRAIQIRTNAGTGSTQPVGGRWRGWNLRRYLDAEHVCAVGVLRLEYEDAGHVYELSTEHHVRNEIRFDHVENWDVNAPQTEEIRGEPESLSLEFDWSRNINGCQLSRLSRDAFARAYAAAVRLYNSSDIHFRNVLVKCGEWLCDLRCERLRHVSAGEQVSV